MGTKQQRTKRRRDRVREDILDVTRALLLDVGPGGVTLAAIAEQLDLTKAALYYYFDSKEALLFELVFETMQAEITAIEERLDTAADGAAAIEAIIRGCGDHYGRNLDSFRLAYLSGQVSNDLRVKPEFLERVRPFNERVYGRAQRLIQADIDGGRVTLDVPARRAAFLAHCAVLGVLTIEGMVAAASDPLVHGHADLLDGLVQVHTLPWR